MTEEQVKAIHISGEELIGIEETHISQVILTDRHAYKIKKPVRFSFLDFSTLALRKHFCERELELNRRLAREIYLAVKPIKRFGNDLFLGQGQGEIIDYAVQMKRLQSDRQMHLLLEHNKVTKNDILAIARVIVDFHRKARILKNSFDPKGLNERFNDLQSVERIIRDNFGKRYHVMIDRIISFSRSFIDQNSTTFRSRIERGLVRDCHGDLHSRNIFLEEDPVVFDCIEFSDAFRAIDLIDEIAFFCMDLEVENQWGFSKMFEEEYLRLLPEAVLDDADRLLLQYYKLYRANVRTKVSALQIGQSNKGSKEQTLKEVQKYLNLMDKYLAGFKLTE